MICASGGQLDLLVPAIAVIPGPQAHVHLHGLNRSIDQLLSIDSRSQGQVDPSDLIPGLATVNQSPMNSEVNIVNIYSRGYGL